jgi:LytS/YehU family sensor histidine kinase
MISRLSDFLRVTLDGASSDEVTLDEEMELARRYLDIEAVRFGERLTVAVEVDPDAWRARVPSMILQPLLENAVRHAVARSETGGRITVAAVRRDGTLRLLVADDGPGPSEHGRSAEGIGLANTRARLHQLYGEAGRLELRPGDAGGATAIVEIPFRSAVAHVAPRSAPP